MEKLTYLDFDIAIEQSGKSYVVKIISSPAGQPFPGKPANKFRNPIDEIELLKFYYKIGRPRHGIRRHDSEEMQIAKRIGGTLFKSVFNEKIYPYFIASLNEAQARDRGLRLRLRVNAPELTVLPWEYLYDPERGLFLSTSIDTPIVRYTELPQRIRPLAAKPPLTILVMICPSDDLDVEEEWKKLQDALDDVIRGGFVTLERLEHASLSALQQRLRKESIHIFHYIGHGGYDETSQDGLLHFEDKNGRTKGYSGTYLSTVLCMQRSLRLVVLNTCEGARASAEDPFSGVAQSILQKGIPSVIGMQFEISDDAAITFAHEFYGAIADGYPIDAALAWARTAIFSLPNDIEWGTPVYFSRLPDGCIFELSGLNETSAQEVEQELNKDDPATVEKAPEEQAKTTIEINSLLFQANTFLVDKKWGGVDEIIRRLQGLGADGQIAARKLQGERTKGQIRESLRTFRTAWNQQKVRAIRILVFIAVALFTYWTAYNYLPLANQWIGAYSSTQTMRSQTALADKTARASKTNASLSAPKEIKSTGTVQPNAGSTNINPSATNTPRKTSTSPKSAPSSTNQPRLVERQKILPDNLNRLALLQSLKVNTSKNISINAIAFSPDSKTIAAGYGSDTQVYFWDVRKGSIIRKLENGQSGITSLSYSPDGDKLVVSSEDGIVNLWDLTKNDIERNKDLGGWISSTIFTGDGNEIYIGYVDAQLTGRVSLWDIIDDRLFNWLTIGGRMFDEMELSSDDETLATNNNWEVKTWDVSSAKEIRTLGSYYNNKTQWEGIAFSNDDMYLAGASDFSNVFIWQVKDGSVVKQIEQRMGSLDYSYDGQLLAGTVYYEDNAILIKLPDGTSIKSLSLPDGFHYYDIITIFSPDGTYLVFGAGNQIQVWGIQ